MTTQAIIAGKGISSFSETRSVASGSGSASDFKKASFDTFINDKSVTDNNYSQDFKESGKTIVNKISKYDNVAVNESSIEAKDVNQLKIDMVDGEIHVTCTDNTISQVINVDELLDFMKEFYSEKLGISKEELEKLLAENGINAFGLLQFENLQNIYASVNGIDDISELLTNEELSIAWNSFVEEIKNSNIELGDMGVVSMSELQKLFGNEEFAETVNDSLALKADKVDTLSNDSTNQNNMINENDSLINAEKQNMANQQSMLSDGETANALSEVKDDKSVNTVTSFDESLFETFMNNVQESMNELQRFDQSQVQQIRDVAMQIIEGVKINVKADTSSLELQLNPESLGKVQVSIEVKEGIATASFFVRDEIVKVAVESQMQTLKDAFEENGLKVDKVEVSVSDFSFEQSNQTFSQEEDKKSRKNSTSGDEINSTGVKALQTNGDETVVDENNGDSQIDVKA